MSQTVEEQISALLDNELPVEEEELLFRQFEKNPEHRAVLGRYSLIRELIVSSDTDPVSLTLSERVRVELRDEVIEVETPAPSKGQTGGGRNLFRFGAAAAVAAVAVMAFINVDYKTDPGQSVLSAGPVLSYAVPEIRADTRTIGPDRLTGYLVSHGEYSNALSQRVMDSRIVRRSPQTVAWQIRSISNDD
jgi:negative regulator of sigma E activity